MNPDDLLNCAQERFDSGDLVGCLEILVSNSGVLPRKPAAELRVLVRQRIAEGAQADPSDERARPLADSLENMLFGYYLEGMESVMWLEGLSVGLAEVLFLAPGHRQATSMSKEINRRFAQAREESDQLFRKGQIMLESEDFEGCSSLLECNEIVRLRYGQAIALRREARAMLKEKIAREPNNLKWRSLLDGFRSRWVEEEPTAGL